ncbi:kappaPI-actitoxin-Avd3d-like [Penaeus chinensis]|uniref:kappaPI-actitoxin-Avd3d-like n=1 Tax=Penaeus chinensis TaxID=139456 RepID=UPI001FB61431|nr:kappaPI-actitoxin-Avd3d-like [Penaeus chinensis]
MRFVLMMFLAIEIVGGEGRDPACDAEPIEGNCGEALLRYFYDSTRDNCMGFIFRGGGDSPNNFMTLEECEKACLS